MDLVIATGFVAALALLALIAGRRLSLTVYRKRSLLFAECLVFALIFAFGFLDRLIWATAIPVAAAMCWANLMPIVLSFAAGLSSEMRSLRPISRRLIAGTLSTLAIGFLILPLARPILSPIELSKNDNWKQGVCLQSNEASCGPAATATLLRQTKLLQTAHANVYRYSTWGQHPLRLSDGLTSERLMAEACLTSQFGTTPLGLYRGIRLSLADSGKQPRVADRDHHAWIAKNQLPNIAVVRFRELGQKGPQRNARQLLGRGGEAHALVVHSRTKDGHWLVADPAVGWKKWTDEEFSNVFTGDAIYIDGLHPDRPQRRAVINRAFEH